MLFLVISLLKSRERRIRGAATVVCFRAAGVEGKTRFRQVLPKQPSLVRTRLQHLQNVSQPHGRSVCRSTQTSLKRHKNSHEYSVFMYVFDLVSALFSSISENTEVVGASVAAGLLSAILLPVKSVKNILSSCVSVTAKVIRL